MGRILLVRHGETIGNLERRLQGPEDPLTEHGRRQAKALGLRLAERHDLTALYSSPLARAFETAQIVGAATGLTPIPREGLAEIDVGDAAGMRFEDWLERFPEVAERFHDEGINFTWPGGESGRQLGSRTAGEIESIIDAHALSAGTVVIVSHGGALAWIIAHLLGESTDEWPRRHQDLENCSITEVAFGLPGDKAVSFVCRNDLSHLPADPDAQVATGLDP